MYAQYLMTSKFLQQRQLQDTRVLQHFFVSQFHGHLHQLCWRSLKRRVDKDKRFCLLLPLASNQRFEINRF